MNESFLPNAEEEAGLRSFYQTKNRFYPDSITGLIRHRIGFLLALMNAGKADKFSTTTLSHTLPNNATNPADWHIARVDEIGVKGVEIEVEEFLRASGIHYSLVADPDTLFVSYPRHGSRHLFLYEGAFAFSYLDQPFFLFRAPESTERVVWSYVSSPNLAALQSFVNAIETYSPAKPDSRLLAYQGKWLADTDKIYDEIKGLTRDDLLLDERMKNDIRSNVENFFAHGNGIYKALGIPQKRGFLFVGEPGCHAAGTQVILFDGSLKSVEEVQVGDRLLGPDGCPREVFKLFRGKDEMYQITPNKGDAFVVNAHHVLNLAYSSERLRAYPDYLNIKVKDYCALSGMRKNRLKLHYSKAIEHPEADLSLEPYFLGIWLGDGTSSQLELTTVDQEIVDYLYEFASRNELQISVGAAKGRARRYRLCDRASQGNHLIEKLSNLSVLNNKQIPASYLSASLAQRLELLAGLIDTDGHLAIGTRSCADQAQLMGWKTYFEFVSKTQILANQVVALAKSVGLSASISLVTKTIKSLNFSGSYYRVNISGDISRIPVRLPRKKASQGRANKDHLRTGIKSIEFVGVGDYYGFNISGDHLYLTSDYMVHHNSGKSLTAKIIAATVNRPFIYVTNVDSPRRSDNEVFTELFQVARRYAPSILCFEDLDSLLTQQSRTHFLQLMDGFEGNNGVLTIATTNFPDKIDPALVNRPSRFDRKYAFAPPQAEYRLIYLKKRFGALSEFDFDLDKMTPTLKQAAKGTDEFSVAMLQELVVSSAHNWLSAEGEAKSWETIILRAVEDTRDQMKKGKGAKLYEEMTAAKNMGFRQ